MNHTIGTKIVVDVETCKLQCYYEHNCVSVNYHVNTKTCELNNATHRWHDNEFKNEDNFLYHGADVRFFLILIIANPPPHISLVFSFFFSNSACSLVLLVPVFVRVRSCLCLCSCSCSCSCLCPCSCSSSCLCSCLHVRAWVLLVVLFLLQQLLIYFFFFFSYHVPFSSNQFYLGSYLFVLWYLPNQPKKPFC